MIIIASFSGGKIDKIKFYLNIVLNLDINSIIIRLALNLLECYNMG